MHIGKRYKPTERKFILRCDDNGLYINDPDDKEEFFLFTAFKGMAKKFTLYEAKTVKGHLIIRTKKKFSVERQ